MFNLGQLTNIMNYYVFIFRVSVYEDNNCSKDWSKRDLGTKFGM